MPLIRRWRSESQDSARVPAAAGAVAPLTNRLHDSNRAVRLAAAFAGAAAQTRRRFWQTVMEALQRIGSAAKGGVPALTEKARDENRLISESARTALKEISPAL